MWEHHRQHGKLLRKGLLCPKMGGVLRTRRRPSTTTPLATISRLTSNVACDRRGRFCLISYFSYVYIFSILCAVMCGYCFLICYWLQVQKNQIHFIVQCTINNCPCDKYLWTFFVSRQSMIKMNCICLYALRIFPRKSD